MGISGSKKARPIPTELQKSLLSLIKLSRTANIPAITELLEVLSLLLQTCMETQTHREKLKIADQFDKQLTENWDLILGLSMQRVMWIMALNINNDSGINHILVNVKDWLIDLRSFLREYYLPTLTTYYYQKDYPNHSTDIEPPGSLFASLCDVFRTFGVLYTHELMVKTLKGIVSKVDSLSDMPAIGIAPTVYENYCYPGAEKNREKIAFEDIDLVVEHFLKRKKEKAEGFDFDVEMTLFFTQIPAEYWGNIGSLIYQEQIKQWLLSKVNITENDFKFEIALAYLCLELKDLKSDQLLIAAKTCFDQKSQRHNIKHTNHIQNAYQALMQQIIAVQTTTVHSICVDLVKDKLSPSNLQLAKYLLQEYLIVKFDRVKNLTGDELALWLVFKTRYDQDTYFTKIETADALYHLFVANASSTIMTDLLINFLTQYFVITKIGSLTVWAAQNDNIKAVYGALIAKGLAERVISKKLDEHQAQAEILQIYLVNSASSIIQTYCQLKRPLYDSEKNYLIYYISRIFNLKNHDLIFYSDSTIQFIAMLASAKNLPAILQAYPAMELIEKLLSDEVWHFLHGDFLNDNPRIVTLIANNIYDFITNDAKSITIIGSLLELHNSLKLAIIKQIDQKKSPVLNQVLDDLIKKCLEKKTLNNTKEFIQELKDANCIAHEVLLQKQNKIVAHSVGLILNEVKKSLAASDFDTASIEILIERCKRDNIDFKLFNEMLKQIVPDIKALSAKNAMALEMLLRCPMEDAWYYIEFCEKRIVKMYDNEDANPFHNRPTAKPYRLFKHHHRAPEPVWSDSLIEQVISSALFENWGEKAPTTVSRMQNSWLNHGCKDLAENIREIKNDLTAERRTWRYTFDSITRTKATKEFYHAVEHANNSQDLASRLLKIRSGR